MGDKTEQVKWYEINYLLDAGFRILCETKEGTWLEFLQGSPETILEEIKPGNQADMGMVAFGRIYVSHKARDFLEKAAPAVFDFRPTTLKQDNHLLHLAMPKIEFAREQCLDMQRSVLAGNHVQKSVLIEKALQGLMAFKIERFSTGFFVNGELKEALENSNLLLAFSWEEIEVSTE